MAPGGFTITSERIGTTVRIAVVGDLDIATAPRLREHWDRERRNGADIILLDLTGLTFIDSSGIHALVDAHYDNDQRLRIMLSGPAARVIDIAGLRDTLPIIEG